MTVLEALRAGLGDPDRFKSLRQRVEMLVEGQAEDWVSGSSSWLVVPLQRNLQGFYLLSEDREGQRRGREVLQAFLGPATAAIEAVQLAPTTEQADRSLQAAGLVQLSYVRRLIAAPGELLDRLEDAVATTRGRDARIRPIRPSHVDLLRDFRLALLQRDGRLAERALADLRLTGQLSAENLRFLTVEMLGSLERWRELRDLPYLPDLLRARRPRVVNEILLEMLWWTEIAELCATGHAPRDIYASADLAGRYGALLGAVDVPANAGGRAVSAVTALALGDTQRLERLRLAVNDEVEREILQRLASADEQPASRATVDSSGINGLFDQGQWVAVVQAFLQAPDPATADLAVQAIFEAEDSLNAAGVLAAIQKFIAEDRLHPDRRLRRDLEDLAQLIGSSCSSWVAWCSRLGSGERWPEAAQVLRSQHDQWEELGLLSPAKVREASDGVLNAWTGVNQDQVVGGLDVLCRVAAASARTMQAGEFCDAVLMVLAEQQNLSAPVREAYLFLVEQLLDAGPVESRYRETLEQAVLLWRRISAPMSVDWVLNLIDVLLNAPAPAPDLRATVIAEVISKARDFRTRLSFRQRIELETLAEEAGLPVWPVEESADNADLVWRRLDGSVVGVYTLLPRAAESLAKRLALLSSPRAVEGNSDTVATAALRALATRADHLIVDTWHASHAATNAIDAVRPRSRQIMPRGRGVTAYLQALEESLTLRAPERIAA